MTPVSEEELHAYLDGELHDSRCAAVAQYLRENPGELQRLAAYRADGEAIRRIFSDAAEGVPASARPRAKMWSAIKAGRWRRLAAAILLLGIGTALGWFGEQYASDRSMVAFARQAAAAHLALASPGAKPLPVSPLDELSQAVSRALGMDTTLRDVTDTGYKIVAANLIPQAKGPAVQLVLRGPDDVTITFFMEAKPGATETPLRRIGSGNVTTLAWEDGNMVCAITSTLEPKQLEAVGRRIYDALLAEPAKDTPPRRSEIRSRSRTA